MFNNDTELFAWMFAFLLNLILPLILFLTFKAVHPKMEWKRAMAFYVGWIPGNVIACWYLHYSIGFLNAFMMLFLCQVFQGIAIAVMGRVLIKMFGFKAFP